MDQFCGSTFWDSNITWHTTDPDFTPCFEKTALLWTACAFLWIPAIFDIYLLSDSRRGASLGHDLATWRPAWTWLTISKLVLITVLILLEIGMFCVTWFNHSGDDEEDNEDIFALPAVIWITPMVLIVTHLLSASLIVLHKSCRVHTSGIQLLHWSLLTFVHALILRTSYKSYPSTTSISLQGTCFVLTFLQSFLFCWSDVPSEKPSQHTRLISCTDGISRQECPLIRCSCLSYILFSWVTPLVRKGYREPLTSHHLWDMLRSLTSPVVFPLFQESYGRPHFTEKRSIFQNIFKPLWNTCGWAFLVALGSRFVATLLSFLTPVLMGCLIDFVQDPETETWKGYMWAGLLTVNMVVMTPFLEMYDLHMHKAFANVLTCLNLAIYQKSMKVSAHARKEMTTGAIVNLMMVDVEKIRMVFYQADPLWSFPIQVFVGVYLLWRELGYALLPGIAVLLTMIPVNWILSEKMSKYQRAQMKKKDGRVKSITEVLSGIQVVKLYAWEPSFLQEIRKVRGEEIGILRKRAICLCAMNFFLESVPFMVSIATFFTYIYLDGGVLDPKKAFTAVTIFALLTDPIQEFPIAISDIIDARVSLKRVNDFLNAAEIDPAAVKFLPKSETLGEPAVEIVKGSFAWEEISSNTWKLEDINLKVEGGTLTAVVGCVASGKSSLLSAILGDMKYSGKVTVRGKIAYVPQIAWILNATVRENICFGLPYNPEKYEEVVDCCCLGPDLEMLPTGDMTEIGENGINLSGGQKQRINLARAAYSEADILLLDDVLSAVDAHVGKQIFDKILGPSGILKNKTRILCTHAYQYLSQVDRIVVLKNGRIVESGNYGDLLKSSGSLTQLITAHIQSKEAGSTGTATSPCIPAKHEDDFERKDRGKLIEDEQLETGDVKLSIFLAYAKALGYHFAVTFVLLFGCSEALSLGRNVVLSQWTSVNASDATPVYSAEYALLGTGQSFLYLLGYFLLAIATLRASQILHNSMLHRILHAPMSFFNVTLLGRITNRFSSDVDKVDSSLPEALADWICYIFKFLGIMVGIFFATNVYFLLYMVPLSLVYYFLQRYYIVSTEQLQRIMNSLKSPIYSQFQETLNGVTTLKAYQAEERFCHLLSEKLDNYNRANWPHQVVHRWLSTRLGFLGSTVVFIPALFAVIWRDTISPSLVGLGISYAVQVTGIVSWLIKMASFIQYDFVSVERIKEYSEVDQEADFDQGKKECPPNWPEKGEILFCNYETRYRPGLELVLKQFSCSIAPREKIGIVGRTGAGKSSVSLALFRIIEAVSGEIRIDGVNIADLGLHRLRKKLTVIPQDPVLFSRSLRLNLDPFGEQGDGKIWEALELAHLKGYVEGLQEGLDFLVAEGGENLSVGQRQLVCLARAILRKSTILIMDEATGSVDSVTDELIQKTIREHFRECTILNVAHRLNTVMDSTRILVVNHGEILEFDTPQNLLSNPKSHFYGMAQDAGIIREA